MSERKDPNTCVRIDRDESQIKRCWEFINNTKSTISDISRIYSLAGNEVRMKILFLLKEEERLCVCDLSEILEMKIPAVSQHLRKLKDAKVVISKREGTVIYYYLNPAMYEVLKPVIAVIEESVPV